MLVTSLVFVGMGPRKQLPLRFSALEGEYLPVNMTNRQRASQRSRFFLDLRVV